MRKLFKRLLFLFSIFLGLYYFGDFRVNDVNVRDTLQRLIPPQKLARAPQTLIESGIVAYRNIRTGMSKAGLVSPPKDAGSAAPPSSPTLPEVGEVAKVLDHLTSGDKEKLHQIIKDNLNVDLDPEKLNQQAKDIEEAARQAGGGAQQ